MSIKTRLVQAGAGLALAGLFVSVNANEAEAASWQPRTVSEIKAEIETQASGQEGTIEYTFAWGDTLWGISEATGIPVNKLAQVNNIENSGLITVGNSIYLSNDSSVVSVKDQNNDIKSYDVSQEEVKETETPVEVKEQAAQPQPAQEQEVQAPVEEPQAEQQTPVQETAEEAAVQAEADRQAEAAAQAEADRQAAAEAAQAQAESERQAAAEAAAQAEADRQAAAQAAEEQAAQESQAQQASTNSNQTAPAQTSSSGEHAAKEWIAQRESGGDYNAVNPTGKYIGRYQLTNSYLGGDHSPANQERVANEYVLSRYGSWQEAKNFWQANGWY